MGDFCQQMLERNAPLRLAPDSPVIGRFFPVQCTAPEGDDLYVNMSGYGYAYTNLSKKLTFTMQASALYRYDFLVTEGDRCDVYAYFRTSRVDASNFAVHRIEGQAANLVNQLTAMGDNFGKQLVGKKLSEGFTVVHYSETNADDFTLGILPLGQKAVPPVSSARRRPHHVRERAGRGAPEPARFRGADQGRGGRAVALRHAQLDGAPAIDVMLMRKPEGDASLQLYYEYPQSGPLAAAPIVADVVQQGVEWKRAIPVPPGMYYVVFDNTSTAGTINPPVSVLDDRAAVVNYLIQIGDGS